MVKEFCIGGEMVKFKTSAALPVFYRELCGREFFTDLQAAESNPGDALDIAYAMYRLGNPESTETKYEWLDKFEFMDIYKQLSEIVGMLSAETKTTSSAKNQRAR